MSNDDGPFVQIYDYMYLDVLLHNSEIRISKKAKEQFLSIFEISEILNYSSHQEYHQRLSFTKV